MTSTLEIGESTKRKVEVKDIDNNLENPSTMTISIWKPDGTLDVDHSAMTNDSIGKYHYWYTVSDQIGTHSILFVATTGGKASKQRDSFEAVAER